MLVRGLALARAGIRKSVTAVGSRADRLIPVWRAALTRGLTAFIFHDVTASPSSHQRTSRSYTSPEVFAEQIAWIEGRFTIVSPPSLPQLGGTGPLPSDAAMITFDDSWAGIFRLALPMLRERGIPAMCFLNMGAVAGDPDLSAVRRYEHAMSMRSRSLDTGVLDRTAGARVLAVIRDRYGDDPGFRRYQGPTATPGDLEEAANAGNVWFGSHLYHHWDLRCIATDLYEQSFDDNSAALSVYPNTLAAVATPYGYAGEAGADPCAIPAARGARVVFTGAGNQNRAADLFRLDRVSLPPEPSSAREWWYATHRRRVLGRRTS